MKLFGKKKCRSETGEKWKLVIGLGLCLWQRTSGAVVAFIRVKLFKPAILFHKEFGKHGKGTDSMGTAPPPLHKQEETSEGAALKKIAGCFTEDISEPLLHTG